MSSARSMALCNGSPRRNADMTLGRTTEGAIKIKTDESGGGLRAVSCECCGGCECGWAMPINPPDDPDFTKKLRGDDPDVAPFTQVSINYSMTISFGQSVSGTFTGSWVARDCEGDLECLFGEDDKCIVRSFSGGASCDYNSCVDCGRFREEFPYTVFLLLSKDGCLTAMIIEEFGFGSFYLTSSLSCPVINDGEINTGPASNGISISINGVNGSGSPQAGEYTVYTTTFFEDVITFASLEITFS